MVSLFKGFFKRNKTSNKSKQTHLHQENSKAVMLKRDSHNVSRKDISKNAVKVLYKLNDAGFQSYLVGGGVRDILLGLKPKDFDVATDATPEQIKSIFRNCRLVGRRFRLAHILFGREVIEVATFRAGHEGNQSDLQNNKQTRKTAKALTDDDGMLVRDNVYGTLIEDAFRRDFTVNALYYTVQDFTVIDYTKGLEDLKAKTLRLIGDPVERYKEDPVRILRAIRLSCKLNLSIEKKTHAPIREMSVLLENISNARLWEECNKMLLSGHAEKTWNALYKEGVADILFSQTACCLKGADSNSESTSTFSSFVQSALINTDKRIAMKKTVNPAFLFSVILWAPLEDLTEKLIKKGLSPYDANQKAGDQVLNIQRDRVGIPRRFSSMIKEIWTLQYRLTILRRKSVLRLLEHPRFRAAYDFLCLRAGDDKELDSLSHWWTEFQELNAQEQDKMLAKVGAPKKRNRKKPTPKPSEKP
ncbi:MAG: poly(A) polymerase [Kangiella sp.]|nr:MAG: poly(A) polymerase [Kangiella sp.]